MRSTSYLPELSRFLSDRGVAWPLGVVQSELDPLPAGVQDALASSAFTLTTQIRKQSQIANLANLQSKEVVRFICTAQDGLQADGTPKPLRGSL